RQFSCRAANRGMAFGCPPLTAADRGVQFAHLLARHRGFPLANRVDCTPRSTTPVDRANRFGRRGPRRLRKVPQMPFDLGQPGPSLRDHLDLVGRLTVEGGEPAPDVARLKPRDAMAQYR